MGSSHPVGHQGVPPGVGDRAKRARWFRRHPRLALLLVAVAFFLVLDVALGSALTLLRIHPIAPKSGSEYRVRHAVYHHTLRPGVECEAHWGPISYEMRTNSLGFRSAAPVDVPLQRTSARRILVIGDSFTEGVGAAFEDSFVGILTEEFEARGIEFLNAAVVSYSPTVYLAKVRHLLEVDGLRFDELVVCIDISDIEDEARFYTMDAEGRVARSTDSSLEEGVRASSRTRPL